MTDFLLELRSEEIPARMQERARADLEKLFVAELAAAGLAATSIITYATPRRLALIAYGLPEQTEAVRDETKGPRASAPPQALEGFLRKTGLTADQLVERDGVLFAVIDKPGRATAGVLSAAIPAIVRAFPWPKAMRWGVASISTESPRWVRPLQGVVAILGEDVLQFEVAGVASGAATVGHCFHHPGIITIGGASDYVEKLRACHVIVDGAERRAIIAEGAIAATRGAGLDLVEDEGLLFENAGLTEWPVPLLGRFDAAFLDVPPEVIQLTARVNQKYFVCRDGAGKLANAFVCCANIEAVDGGAKIVEGNRKVLAARLSDARFFYETDRKTSLADQAKKLDKIVFHETLGTVADKSARVAKLAEWLSAEGIVPGADPRLARQAAELSKADLVTGMVGEFPELQGLMGGYYARAEGLADVVADAIRDHYKPVGQGDDVPTAPSTEAVSLADKLDTLVAFFLINMPPTGSRDPYALRRAAIGIGAIITSNQLRIPLQQTLAQAIIGIVETALHWAHRVTASVGESTLAVKSWTNLVTEIGRQDALTDAVNLLEASKVEAVAAMSLLSLLRRLSAQDVVNKILEVQTFVVDRLKVQQREAGVRHDLIDAVFALGGEDDLVRLLARVKALQAFITTDDGANLLAGYKRAANILKKEGVAESSPARGGGPSRSDGGGGVPQAQRPAEPPLHPPAAPGGSPPRAGEEYTLEPEEADLLAALETAESAAGEAVAAERFEAAMAALATLRAPIDAFFDKVTVNDADPDKRAARLAMLARVRAACNGVADFSKIEG